MGNQGYVRAKFETVSKIRFSQPALEKRFSIIA